MKEIEVKILNIDIDVIRKKMKAINAIKVKEENQINNIFDFPDRRLLEEKGYARVRIVDDLINNCKTFYMTTKRMLSQDTYKIMDEREVIVDNSDFAEGIFKALGLELIGSVKKYRESYKYKNTLVEIDVNDKSFCPFPYIEIESEDENELIEVVNLLGYSIEDTTAASIYDILEGKSGIKGL